MTETKPGGGAWWAESAYASEIQALGEPGKRFLLYLESGATNVQDLMLVAIPTARMVDRMDRINERLAKDQLMPGGKPNRLLAELVRVEKQYLMNLRSLGVCDKDEKRRQKDLVPY
jgi:hypothetical protein